MKLLVFNPETEYALASGASFYTPPAVVDKFRRENQLLPEAWAGPYDFILVDDVEGLSSRFSLVDWSMLQTLFRKYPDMEVEPWGWNKALRRRLVDHGVPSSAMPDEAYIERLRMSAHRRTTISLNKEWNEAVGVDDRVGLPVELFSEEDCLSFMRATPGCWMKAPWSSSGRGVINTAADMTEEQVRQWCHGIIRRQGSVLAETPADRVADFATEWILRDGEASYLGLSCFHTSRRGKYISNEFLPQDILRLQFNALGKMALDDVVKIQRRILGRVIPSYSGPLGVDMIVGADGSIRPFVEVNLRRTMGMLHL